LAADVDGEGAPVGSSDSEGLARAGNRDNGRIEFVDVGTGIGVSPDFSRALLRRQVWECIYPDAVIFGFGMKWWGSF
jgi:hypothetical protein